MPIEPACKLVIKKLKLKVDLAIFRRMYDRALTPEARLLNEIVKAVGAFSTTETPRSDTQEAARRYQTARPAKKDE